jgi:hypothetical protein
MRGWMLMLLITFAVTTAFAQESHKASGNETPAADAAPVKPDADAAVDVKEDKPFRIPPGFRTKTRGGKMVYCRKETISGSRFGSEGCFTEEQLVQKAAENEAARQEVERSLRTCSNEAACGNR